MPDDRPVTNEGGPLEATLTSGTSRQGNQAERPMSNRRGRRQKIVTVGELLHWSYANLASAENVAQRGIAKPDTLCWMIRAKLFKGLRTGTMSVGTLFADVREMPRDRCVYCAAPATTKLHADHLIPRHRHGLESADNLVWACRSCNSSKGRKDLLEWYADRASFPPLALMRRYLKLAMAEAQAKNLMDVPLEQRRTVTFSIEFIPTWFPSPAVPVVIERHRP
jgi:hypothetical protein